VYAEQSAGDQAAAQQLAGDGPAGDQSSADAHDRLQRPASPFSIHTAAGDVSAPDAEPAELADLAATAGDDLFTAASDTAYSADAGLVVDDLDDPTVGTEAHATEPDLAASSLEASVEPDRNQAVDDLDGIIDLESEDE